MNSAVRLERRDRIAWITVDRPEVRNALDLRTLRALRDLVQDLGKDQAVRCIVLRGGGDHVFVSGADIRDFKTSFESPEGGLAYDTEAERLHTAIETARQPVIAMLNGHAIGSGCLLALPCDFRIASRRAKLGIPIARVGFCISPPDLVRLAALVGLARAKRLLMTAELIDAAEAHRIGLADEVAEPDDLETVTAGLAGVLAANAPLSLKTTKAVAKAFVTGEPSVEAGRAHYVETYGSRDLAEGIDALLEKRQPRFHGR